MGRILTLELFADRVAILAGISPEEARRAILAVFDSVRDGMSTHPGSKAVLPGIGTFSSAPDGSGNVTFVADADFAEAVNEPFAMFDPIELDSDDDIAIAQETVPVPDMEEVTEDEPASADKAVADEMAADEIETDGTEGSGVISEEATEEVASAETSVPEADLPPSPSRHTIWPAAPTQPPVAAEQPLIVPAPKTYRMGWLALGIVIGAVIGYLTAALVYSSAARDTIPAIEVEVEADSIGTADDAGQAAVATATPQSDTSVSDRPVTRQTIMRDDTVTTRRYITHMAKEYYGDRAFWVYIYEANADRLGHPERTLPGTVVHIPDPATIPADPADADDLREARRLAAEIYARFAN